MAQANVRAILILVKENRIFRTSVVPNEENNDSLLIICQLLSVILFGQQRQCVKDKKWKKRNNNTCFFGIWSSGSCKCFFLFFCSVGTGITVDLHRPGGANVCNCNHHRDKIIHCRGYQFVELKRAFC